MYYQKLQQLLTVEWRCCNRDSCLDTSPSHLPTPTITTCCLLPIKSDMNFFSRSNSSQTRSTYYLNWKFRTPELSVMPDDEGDVEMCARFPRSWTNTSAWSIPIKCWLNSNGRVRLSMSFLCFHHHTLVNLNYSASMLCIWLFAPSTSWLVHQRCHGGRIPPEGCSIRHHSRIPPTQPRWEQNKIIEKLLKKSYWITIPFVSVDSASCRKFQFQGASPHVTDERNVYNSIPLSSLRATIRCRLLHIGEKRFGWNFVFWEYGNVFVPSSVYFNTHRCAAHITVSSIASYYCFHINKHFHFSSFCIVGFNFANAGFSARGSDQGLGIVLKFALHKFKPNGNSSSCSSTLIWFWHNRSLYNIQQSVSLLLAKSFFIWFPFHLFSSLAAYFLYFPTFTSSRFKLEFFFSSLLLRIFLSKPGNSILK